MHWRTKLANQGFYVATYPFKGAVYIVVGIEPGIIYPGIIAYADNEVAAYRIRRAVISEGGRDVKVLPYTPNVVNSVEQSIEDRFFSTTKEDKLDMSNDNVKPEDTFAEPIIRDVGERVRIDNGRDYKEPLVRIVVNTHPKSQDHEKAVYISQGSSGVSLSLETLQKIIDWALGG